MSWKKFSDELPPLGKLLAIKHEVPTITGFTDSIKLAKFGYCLTDYPHGKELANYKEAMELPYEWMEIPE